MAAVFNGTVQGASLIAAGTPAALCRVVEGGSLSGDYTPATSAGTGGQIITRKGITKMSWAIQGVDILPAVLAKFFPSAAGVAVEDFLTETQDLLLTTDDGTNGKQWVLSANQPDSVSLTLDADDNALLKSSISGMALAATLQAAGTDTHVYTSTLGHRKCDITVSKGAAEFGTIGFTLSNTLGAMIRKFADGATPKTSGDAILFTDNGPTFSWTTSEPVYLGTGTTTVMDADEFVDEDITITCANGTAGENITISLIGFVPTGDSVEVQGKGGDVIGFQTNMVLGSSADNTNSFGRVTFA